MKSATNILKKVEKIAEQEQRSTDEVLRDMMESYERTRKQREEEEENDWVMNLIKEAQEEQKRNPKAPEEIVEELRALGRDVAAEAKKRGITGKDVNRIIYESRKRWETA
jgi:histone H3/H4